MAKIEGKYQRRMESELCTLYLVATDEGLLGVHWRAQKVPLAPGRPGEAGAQDPAIRWLDHAARQLGEYLCGRRTEFDIPLVRGPGTAFQHRVWEQLRGIPYGRTISYGELARRVGRAAAIRAVGTANGRNPLSIVVPCHRVIGADGSLRGYAGTPAVKQRLLDLEGAVLAPSRR